MAKMTLHEFLMMQRQLQIRMKEASPHLAGDPMELEGDERADFMRWNAFALDDEIHEALAEVGWKPWATKRHVNHPQFMQEMVDAWHFFLNLLLAGAGAAGLTIKDMATMFENYYLEKNAKNLQRQIEGYDGVKDKCPVCKRELDGLPSIQAEVCLPSGIEGPSMKFCSEYCHIQFHQNEERYMSMHDPDRVREMRDDIDRRSVEGGSLSAEESAEAAMQKHRAAQQAAGYEPTPHQAETLWEPPVGQKEPMPEIKTAESILAKARANGEPVFVFRAKDFFSVMILAHYAEIIEKYGPDDADFHRDVIDHLNEFKQWQRENVDKVRYPD